MDLPSGPNRRYATTAVILLGSIWLWVAFDRPYVFPDHIPWNTYSNSPQVPANDIFNFPPLTSPAIKRVCADTQWNTSLVFTCDSPAGSFAEVRNSALHCVRYTIAAGGSLVMPRIVLKEDYGGLLAGNTTGLDHLFDAEHFTTSLKLSCPQLRLYMAVSDLESREQSHGPIPLTPDSLVSTKPKAIEKYSSEWREGLEKWLTKYISADTKAPFIISLSRSYLRYPIHSDHDQFAQHFGKMLKIRSDIRILAETVLEKVWATIPSNQSGFLAAYLSTASDPDRLTKEDQHYALYETQSQLYLDYTTPSNISVMYVASNQDTDVPRFAADAKPKGIEVKAKFDLVESVDLADLQDMTTIQREAVDYLVMIHAATLLGVGSSGFSWNEALRRHKNWETAPPSDPAEQFNDGLSLIFGKAGGHSGFLESMWP